MRASEAGIWSRLKALQNGHKVPGHFEFDGCTCAPDKPFGIDIRAACCVHDWEYEQGGSERDRAVADRRFYRNMRRLGLGRFTAGVYYRRVRLLGCLKPRKDRGFNYRTKRPPLWLLLPWVFVTRYLPVF